jgi:glutamate synthase (NADPH) large chain
MPNTVSRKNNDVQDHGLANALDNQLITLASNALETKQKINIDLPISNTNRTVGTMLSNQIAIRYGNLGLDDDTITVNFTGTSGQSFAAFLAKGITFNLTGEGNDYVGKGLFLKVKQQKILLLVIPLCMVPQQVKHTLVVLLANAFAYVTQEPVP